jgi:MFS family permease
MQDSAAAEARAQARPAAGLIETTIPARLDRLGWGRFHTLVVLALGITWILDGLEVTLAGAVAGALRESPTLVLSNAEVGLASSFYLAGAVLGALLCGWLTDRLCRKRLFFITLGVYLVSTAPTAFAWDFSSFALFRFLVQGSAANIQPLPPAFRSLCRRATAAIPISSSMVASG